MVFGSSENSRPETMLNSHKVSRQRKHPVNFPKIGLGRFQSMGSNHLILVGSKRELIFDLGGLREKYSIRCQISGSKNMPVQFHRK